MVNAYSSCIFLLGFFRFYMIFCAYFFFLEKVKETFRLRDGEI